MGGGNKAAVSIALGELLWRAHRLRPYCHARMHMVRWPGLHTMKRPVRQSHGVLILIVILGYGATYVSPSQLIVI